jgi:hypothetical protein
MYENTDIVVGLFLLFFLLFILAILFTVQFIFANILAKLALSGFTKRKYIVILLVYSCLACFFNPLISHSFVFFTFICLLYHTRKKKIKPNIVVPQNHSLTNYNTADFIRSQFPPET